MLRVVKSELYKLRNRKYLYVMLGILSVCIIGFTAIVAADSTTYDFGDRQTMDSIISLVVTSLSLGSFLGIFMTQVVFSDEYKNGTLKNSIAMGVSRRDFFFGKLIVQMIAAFLSMAVLMLVAIGSGYFLLGSSADSGELLRMLLERILLSIPLWLGTLSLSNMLAFSMKSSGGYITVYLLTLFFSSDIFQLLGQLISPVFNTIRGWMAVSQLANFSNSVITNTMITKSLIVGLGYLIVGSIIGYMAFRKRELH